MCTDPKMNKQRYNKMLTIEQLVALEDHTLFLSCIRTKVSWQGDDIGAPYHHVHGADYLESKSMNKEELAKALIERGFSRSR